MKTISYIQPKMDARYLELLKEIERSPKKILQEVERYAKEENQPESLSLLAYAYLKCRKLKAAEEIIKQCYGLYPDHLTCRINYADQCLRKKRFKEIPKIFPSFKLEELYPKRSQFYVSEYRGFLVVMGQYHLAIKDLEEAEKYYIEAVKADPLHPSIVYLEKALRRKRFIKRIAQFLK